MPDVFQRTLPVSGQPPFAEPHLQQEDEKADRQTGRIAAMRCEVQSEGEIDEGSQDGLRDVVRQAHPSVEPQAADGFGEFPVPVRQDERGDEDQREGQFLPHVEDRSDGLPHDRVSFHGRLAERVQRSEGDGCADQYPHPNAEVLPGGLEKPLPADVAAQKEQSGGLDEPPGVHGPQQTGFLAQGEVAREEASEIPGFRIFGRFRIQGVHSEVGQPVRGSASEAK